MNVLKLKKLLVSLLIIILISVNASALSIEEHYLDLEIGDEYTVLTPDNLKKNQDFIKSLGHSLTSMQTFFKDNGVLLFAANEDNSKQIKLTYNQTDFSRQIGSLRTLSDEKIEEISGRILGEEVKDKYSLFEPEDHNMKMYCVASKGLDNGGIYTTMQYFTIINGGIYNLSYSESSADAKAVSETAQELVLKLQIVDKDTAPTAKDFGDTVTLILIAVLILAAVAVAVYIIVTFVKDAKGKGDTQDEASVIRRRRF